MNWENFVDIGWGEMNRKTDVLLHSPVDMEHCGRLFVVSQWESVSWQQGIRQSSIVIRGHTGTIEERNIREVIIVFNLFIFYLNISITITSHKGEIGFT